MPEKDGEDLVHYDRVQKDLQDFHEEVPVRPRGKYSYDDIALPRARGRQEIIWHDNELPEKVYPEEHEPQIRLVRNVHFGKHVRAHKQYEKGETVLIQKAYLKMCPIENNVCRRCLKETYPWVPCQNKQSAPFNDKMEKVRNRLVYDYGPNVLHFWDLAVKFMILYMQDRRYARLLRLSRPARTFRQSHDTLILTQWLVEMLPMRLTDDFQDFDYQMMMKLLLTNRALLRTMTPNALYNQITFFPHHCYPTCTVVETDKGAAVICVSPDGITEGQPVSLSWVLPIMPREQRNKLIKKEMMGADCRCSLCMQENDFNRVFHSSNGRCVHARLDTVKWICDEGIRHEKEFIQDCRKEESKLTRIIARQNFKPGQFDIHEFLKTSKMHPQHYLVYEFTHRQAEYIYNNSLIEHYDLAKRNWQLTIQCITHHPSMYYHTNTLDILTKLAQISINLQELKLAENFLDEAQYILDFIAIPITNFKMRVDTLRTHCEETPLLEESFA